jgi:hypothetical protein
MSVLKNFKDRLISAPKIKTFSKALLKDILKINFKREWQSLVHSLTTYCGRASFLPIYPDGDTTKKPLNDIYCELTRSRCSEKEMLTDICKNTTTYILQIE